MHTTHFACTHAYYTFCMYTHIPRMHAHISNIPQSHHNSCTPHTLLMHTHYTYLHGPHVHTHLLPGFWVSVTHSLSACLCHCSLLAQASSLAMDSSPPDYCTSHFTFSVFHLQWAGLLDPEGAFLEGGCLHALSPLTGTQLLADLHASLGSLSKPICHLPAPLLLPPS